MILGDWSSDVCSSDLSMVTAAAFISRPRWVSKSSFPFTPPSTSCLPTVVLILSQSATLKRCLGSFSANGMLVVKEVSWSDPCVVLCMTHLTCPSASLRVVKIRSVFRALGPWRVVFLGKFVGPKLWASWRSGSASPQRCEKQLHLLPMIDRGGRNILLR